MKYAVRHTTIYTYSGLSMVSHHAARMQPKDTARQRCLSARLVVEPVPPAVTETEDYFGNRVSFFVVQQPHRTLTVEARSMVEVTAPPSVDAMVTPPWEIVRDRLRRTGSVPGCGLDSAEYLYEAPFTGWSADLLAYALPSFTAGRPILDAALDLTARIHADFAYDPTATTTTTPLAEVMALRRGVCQDFAHLEIACLRAVGLPARYVSGYLLTRPPPEQVKLVGSDASHAWVSVHVPGAGWVDLDPTNNLVVGDEHVTCAWGRDFEDVSPLKGVTVGGGDHSLRVAVDVAPQE